MTFLTRGLIATLLLIVTSAENCDRERSRLARSVIDKYVVPYAYWNKYEFPENCPLHPEQDKFSTLHKAKHQVSSSHWNCTVCGEGHDNENSIDQHMHTDHDDLIKEDEGQCLADICDILHCDYIAEEVLGKSGEGVDPYARHLPCDPSEEQKIRQRCRALAEVCFPVEGGPQAPLMWSFFHGHICAAHNCKDDVRRDLLTTVVQSRPHIQWGYKIFAGFVTMILLGFYVIFWLYLRFYVGVIGEDEFTSLRPKKQHFNWPWIQKSQAKEL